MLPAFSSTISSKPMAKISMGGLALLSVKRERKYTKFSASAGSISDERFISFYNIGFPLFFQRNLKKCFYLLAYHWARTKNRNFTGNIIITVIKAIS